MNNKCNCELCNGDFGFGCGASPSHVASQFQKIIKQSETRRRLLEELCEEWTEECNPTCSSYGHDGDCKSINLGQAKKAMRLKIEKLTTALEFLIDRSPHDGDQSACLYCDMGGAGYSSKGDGNHDDIRYVCPVVVALIALNRR